jgi:hypothetical protein
VDRKFINSPFAKIVVVVVFLAAIAAYALYPRRIPPPDKANRVYHPSDGYSIIAPPGWKAGFEFASSDPASDSRGQLRVDPPRQGYYPPSIVVRVRDPKTDPDKLKTKDSFVDGTFHGQPALVKAFRLHKMWSYAVVYHDHDKWIDICIATPDYYDFPKSMWWPYIESFKYEPEKAMQMQTAATMPDLKIPTSLPADLTH